MNMLAKILHYLRHQANAKSRYGIHSPFVYHFVTQVLPPKPCRAQVEAEKMRKALLSSLTTVEIEDFGAGYSGISRPLHSKSIQEILISSARRPKEGSLLYRIALTYQPDACLELGTNLGFSTLYQAMGAPESRFISIEGASNLAKIAASQLPIFGAPQVEIIHGDFMDVLQNRIDWANFSPAHVLLDGNHREEATIAYFEYLLPKVKDGAMILLDDINWSPGMQRAWKHICKHKEVSVSMDLWHLGICAIRRDQAKEHFLLRF